MKAIRRQKAESPAPASRSADSLTALLASGDVRRARARARAVLEGAAATEEERTAARDVIARSGFERFALFAAAGVLALQVLWTVLLYTA